MDERDRSNHGEESIPCPEGLKLIIIAQKIEKISPGL
jgi:hypothetical protein